MTCSWRLVLRSLDEGGRRRKIIALILTLLFSNTIFGVANYYLASGSYDYTIKIWEKKKNWKDPITIAQKDKKFTSWVSSVAFSL